MDAFTVTYAPLGCWLSLLVQGWQFDSWIVEPMRGHHGFHAVLMVRDAT